MENVFGGGWESYERMWRRHAEGAEFSRKRREAVTIAREGAKRGRLFNSLSGGKDSVAMSGILVEAGIDVPAVHATTVFNLPDMMETAIATADKIDLALAVIAPDEIGAAVAAVAKRFGVPPPAPSGKGGEWDEVDILRAVPADTNILAAYEEIGRHLAAANLLIGHMYREEFEGSFVGIRGEESKSRKKYQNVWGPIHQSAVDQTWQVCPLLGWTGTDVFAYTLVEGLPLHPFYRRVWERFHSREDPARIRVDMALMPERIAGHGALAAIGWAYPAFLGRIIAVRPELRQYL